MDSINVGNENCPNCDGVNECYLKCASNHTAIYTNISSWSDCKDKCKGVQENRDLSFYVNSKSCF